MLNILGKVGGKIKMFVLGHMGVTPFVHAQFYYNILDSIVNIKGGGTFTIIKFEREGSP